MSYAVIHVTYRDGITMSTSVENLEELQATVSTPSVVSYSVELYLPAEDHIVCEYCGVVICKKGQPRLYHSTDICSRCYEGEHGY